MAGIIKRDCQEGHKDHLGPKKDAGCGGGPGLDGGLLEGRRPGPPGAGLPSLALGPDHPAVPGPGPGTEGGHGGHNGEVGALSHPAATGPGSRETGGQADQALHYLC